MLDNKLTGFDFIELWDHEEQNYKDIQDPIEWQDPFGTEALKTKSFSAQYKDTMQISQ